MPVGVSAFVPLATTTLASSSATVTFSSISGAYRDLRIVVSCQAMSGTGVMAMQFNTDTGSNYSYVGMYAEASPGSESATTTFIKSSVSNVTSNELLTVDVMDYSATDKHKTALLRVGNASANLAAYAGRWANTAAITSVKLYHTGTNQFGAGATVSLYGIASA